MKMESEIERNIAMRNFFAKRVLLFVTIVTCIMMTGCAQDIGNLSVNQNVEDNTTQSSEKNTESDNNERINYLTDLYGRVVDKEGTIYIDSEENITIVGKDDKILKSSAAGDFDEIYAYGDGYYALWKDVSNFEKKGTILWVIDSSGNELLHLDDPNYQYIEDYSSGGGLFFGSLTKQGTSEYKIHQNYCGEGWIFFLKDYDTNEINYDTFDADYYNLISKEWKSMNTYNNYSAIDLERTEEKLYYSDGYEEREVYMPDFRNSKFCSICLDSKSVSIIDSGLNELSRLEFTNDENKINFGSYSDGGFIYTSYNKNMLTPQEISYFDCQNSSFSQIDFKDLDKLNCDDYTYKFINGAALVSLKGEDDHPYCAVIDKQGNYIKEPYPGIYKEEINNYVKNN